MQAKKRYFTAAVFLLTLLCCYFALQRSQNGDNSRPFSEQELLSFLEENDLWAERDLHASAKQRRETRTPGFDHKYCRMETCFDFSRCRNGFKVYVYPVEEKVSQIYGEILSALKDSRFYTQDPHEACLFVLSIDTLDRDVLSAEFVKKIKDKLDKLIWWMNGQNHIIFNSYSGTWPDYAEDALGFHIGKAILAKASISEAQYRPHFDISFPLFHKEHDSKGGQSGYLQANNVPPIRKYTLVFKGKRYLVGIGSETRNSLYHIHNGEDIVLLTTCKHGRGWKSMQDERCERDNLEYDKSDYKTLLHNSTFCLVPRGRRLGSYRFLESLQAACIPVMLSNGWVLPFAEVIDWNKAVVWGDERLLLQIPSIVRSTSHADILLMRQQTQLLWETYFSSIAKIVGTTLEIVKDRVQTHMARTAFVWNSVPGAIAVQPEYAPSAASYPFFYSQLAIEPTESFTAVIYATAPSVMASAPITRLIRSLAKSKYLDRILILWHCDTPPPIDRRWPVPRHVSMLIKQISTLSGRLFPYDEIRTDAVLGLDEDVLLTTDEVDFAFTVWRQFPSRIVGYPARNHYWDDSRSRWSYTSKWTNDYSMVLTSAAFYHRYYLHMYSFYLGPELRHIVDTTQNCEDILMNFLVTHVTKSPPIKVTQRKIYKDSMLPGGDQSVAWLQPEHLRQRQTCINKFAESFGYMPLIRSSLRLDPVLFKDPVSMSRKRYRQIENV